MPPRSALPFVLLVACAPIVNGPSPAAGTEPGAGFEQKTVEFELEKVP